MGIGIDSDPDTAIISAVHPYLDFITLKAPYGTLSQERLTEINFLGVPLSKIGLMIGYFNIDSVSEIVDQVKELGLAGVSLFSINSENESYRGELAQRIAEALYL